MNACETAQTTVTMDSQGRSWEHFLLGDDYVFSNQIPNLESFTRTDPGWVLNDNTYCQWESIPPDRIRQDEPVNTVPLTTEAPTQTAGMEDGGFGLLVLLAAGGAAVLWWINRGKQPDPNYHPMADLEWDLPRLGSSRQSDSLPEEIEWDGVSEIPPGYEVIDDEPEKKFEASGVTEPSPWLNPQLTEQIDAHVQNAISRIPPMVPTRPHSQRAEPAGVHEAEPPIEPGGSGGSEPVHELVQNRFRGGSRTGSEPVHELVQNRFSDEDVRHFEENVVAFCPLKLDEEDPTTREAVSEALRLGKSKNWIISQLFGVQKGGSRLYANCCEIVDWIKGTAQNETP